MRRHIGLSQLLLLLVLGLWVSSSGASGPTVEEMAAQMLMVGFRGTEAGPDSAIRRHIAEGRVGNVILFSRDLSEGGDPERNVHSPRQLAELTRALAAAAPRGLPLWIAVDQEGGKVQRLRPSRGFARDWPSAEELGAKDDLSLTQETARLIGQELSELGIGVDFAPVADVNVNPKSPAIGAIGRSFGADPEAVARQAAAFSEGLQASGVIPCLKHFPGHGSASGDTHLGAADVTETWSEAELVPYEKAFKSGYRGLVMSCHVFNSSLDPELPASLSKKIMTGLLRERLGWQGVIVTDDLDMGALATKYSEEERIRLAVEAGADLLTFSSNAKGLVFDPDRPRKLHETLVRLVEEGRISEARLRQSWERIAAVKKGLTGGSTSGCSHR